MNSGDTIQSRMPVDAEIQVMYAEGVSYLCFSNQMVWLGHPWHQYPTVGGRLDRASREPGRLRTRWCFLDQTWLCKHLDRSAKKTPSLSLTHTKYLSNSRLSISLPTEHSGTGETLSHEDRRGQEFSGHFPEWSLSPSH